MVSAGGPDERSLVAYHRQNGAFVWGGGADKAGFSSPRLVTLAGREQILIFNNHSVVAHDPHSGIPLWHQPWDRAECIANPLLLPGDRVLASTGYGIGAKLYQVNAAPDSGLTSDLIWKSPRLKAKLPTWSIAMVLSMASTMGCWSASTRKTASAAGSAVATATASSS